MQTAEFHERARLFLNSLLRQRDYLIANGKCKKNTEMVSRAATHIRLHLEANGYRTNRQMVHFWNANEYKIRILLPGIGSTAYESMLATFNGLNYEAVSWLANQGELLLEYHSN